MAVLIKAKNQHQIFSFITNTKYKMAQITAITSSIDCAKKASDMAFKTSFMINI